jgi:sugar phosphate isomerase/epimerase
MQIRGYEIGVCSWSLGTSACDRIVESMRELELDHLQLALAPILDSSEAGRDAYLKTLTDAGIKITAGMLGFEGEDYTTIQSIRQTGGYVPDGSWQARRERTFSAIQFCASVGIKRFSTHAGFIPRSGDPLYHRVIERLREIALELQTHGVEMLLETGQETASELLQFLNDLNSRMVHVNFDPANMLLYGCGDPIEAIRVLERHVQHVHVKDAIASDQPRVRWGTEVPFGNGQVACKKFIGALRHVGYDGPLMIECESGPQRMDWIRAAIATLAST